MFFLSSHHLGHFGRTLPDWREVHFRTRLPPPPSRDSPVSGTRDWSIGGPLRHTRSAAVSCPSARLFPFECRSERTLPDGIRDTSRLDVHPFHPPLTGLILFIPQKLFDTFSPFPVQTRGCCSAARTLPPGPPVGFSSVFSWCSKHPGLPRR